VKNPNLNWAFIISIVSVFFLIFVDYSINKSSENFLENILPEIIGIILIYSIARSQLHEEQKKKPQHTYKPPKSIKAYNPSSQWVNIIPFIFLAIFLVMIQEAEPTPLFLTYSVVFSFFFLILGIRSLQQKRLIDDMPTLKTIGAFIGQVELAGTAESENPLTSPIAGTKCVYYSWNSSVRFGAHWVSMGSGKESSTFYLKDDTGVIRIDPENALLIPEITIDANDQKGETREELIPLHAPLYVIGHVRERTDMVAAEVAYDEDNPLYIISTKRENYVSNVYRNRFLLLAATGFLISIIIPRMLLDQAVHNIPGVVFVAALILGWFLVVYNSLAKVRNNVDQAWSLIDIQLERRTDLIPNLVELIEGYREYEEEIQTQIAKLRSQTLDQENPIRVATLIQSVVEAYPELKAGQRFLDLQRALEETEQRIALARDYYNQLTRFYNARLMVVPDVFVAKLCGLEPRLYWAGENFIQTQEEINFAS
jgi:hypothetical protein